MSVKYILSQVGAKVGIDPASSQRPVLLRFLNEAARELYTQFDPVGSLMEQVFKVNGDQTISCPWYVGKIRGLREYASQQVWHINQMRPRYNQMNWIDMWRNYRLLNKRALMATVKNESHGIITVPFVEDPPIVVTLTGPTSAAQSISEEIIINATRVESKTIFLDYDSVKKDRVNTCDVTLSDIDDSLLTVIPNTELTALYQIIDVSSCPWLPQNTSVLDNYVEILYKKTLPYLSNDADEFPAPDFDDVIVNKMMQLWFEEQKQPELAAAYDAKASRTSARLQEDQNRATEDVVSLVANPHDTVLKRIGSGLRRRYSMYGGRYP